jgi:hypothetical protein
VQLVLDAVARSAANSSHWQAIAES